MHDLLPLDLNLLLPLLFGSLVLFAHELIIAVLQLRFRKFWELLLHQLPIQIERRSLCRQNAIAYYAICSRVLSVVGTKGDDSPVAVAPSIARFLFRIVLFGLHLRIDVIHVSLSYSFACSLRQESFLNQSPCFSKALVALEDELVFLLVEGPDVLSF